MRACVATMTRGAASQAVHLGALEPKWLRTPPFRFCLTFQLFGRNKRQRQMPTTKNKNCKPFPNTDVQDRHKGPRMPAALPYLLTWHIRLRPLQACKTYLGLHIIPEANRQRSRAIPVPLWGCHLATISQDKCRYSWLGDFGMAGLMTLLYL